MTKGSVTLKDVYEIAERLEGKFDEQFKDHEARLRVMERFQNKALGIFSLVSIFSGVVATYIWSKVVAK